MHIIKKIIFLLSAIWISMASGSEIKNDSLHFEILLSSKLLNDIHLDARFINSIDITSKHLILISTNDQFFLLGWGGVTPIGKKADGNISSFAYTPDSLLMAIINNDLCGMDSLGYLSKLFKLPNEGMGISAGKYVMYVYDRNKDVKQHALYMIAKGGKYAKLFDVPAPIQSAVEMNNSILFATENGVFNYNLKSKQLKALAALPKNKGIKSIAVDGSNNRIYFSTDSAVYALKDTSVVIITKKLGGTLRFFAGGLMVFNPEKKFLVRIMGIETIIASMKQPIEAVVSDKQTTETHTETPITKDKPTAEILTNSSVIKMVKSNLSDDLIINVINSSIVNFNTSIDSIISLSSQNVSSPVIKAMKNAMKSKTDSSSNGNNLTTANQAAQNNTTSNTKNTTVKNFYIIARSCPTEQQANDAIAGLKSQGFPDAEIVGKNEYGSYRIAYKSYATNEEAAKALINIKQTINPSAWIFEKK